MVSMSEDRVAAVVVNYRNDVDTRRCLERLGELPNVSVLLVNNGGDSQVEPQQWVETITSANRGFAAACNLAIKRALSNSYEYIWLVNNDLFVEPSTLSALLDAIQSDQRIAAVAPKILYDDKPEMIQYAGGFARTDCSPWFPRGDWEMDTGRYDLIEPVDWTSGACMLISAAAISDVGLLDESYFLYYEDVDWCIRAKRSDWKSLYVGTCQVRHGASRSTVGVRDYYTPRARFIFLAKHYPHLLGPALRQHYHHRLLPHLKQRAPKESLTDFKVYLSFFYYYITRGLRSVAHA
jgi:GT2 family glycosyltransferase